MCDFIELLEYYLDHPEKESCTYTPKQPKKPSKRTRLNRYERKREGQRRLRKIHRQGSSYFHSFTHTYDKRGFYSRFYLSGVRGYIKFCSDKAVRNRRSEDFCLRGAGYRRVFDYAYTLF